MYGRTRHHRRRFGRSNKPTTKTSTGIQQRRGRCQGCKQMIEKGEDFVRIRLRKDLAVPCPGCGLAPKRSKRFHTRCLPTDHEKAMGYDPNRVHTHSAPSPEPARSVPPPPKPKNTNELKIESLLAFEAALSSGMRDRSVKPGPDLDKALATINNLKARILRPGTEGEGDAATNVTLKKLIDLVFGTRS